MNNTMDNSENSPYKEWDNQLQQKYFEKWSEHRRKQLDVSSNIYFGFASASLAFMLNTLIKVPTKDIPVYFQILVTISAAFFIISILFYAIFSETRYKNYLMVERYFFQGKSLFEVYKLCQEIYKKIGLYYLLQKIALLLGVIFTLVSFGVYVCY